MLYLNPDGTVMASWKISDTEGNFEGELQNADWFSFDPSPVGDLNGDGIVDGDDLD